jgi:general secretion pathway protein A
MPQRHGRFDRDPFLGMDAEARYVSTPVHDEAVARLLHAIDVGERLVLLRAEAGLGKTAVLARALDEARDPRRKIVVRKAPVDGPSLWSGLAHGLGRRARRCASRGEAWKDLCDAVRVCRLQGLSMVLAIDDDQTLRASGEGQDLDRLVYLGEPSHSGLTVIRVGHPTGEIEPLADWGPAIPLVPLSRSEAGSYVRAKLAAAGRDEIRFTPGALTRLHALSRGVPRGLDRLASLAIFAAASEGLDQVPPEVVDGVASACVQMPADA